jgi:hypothetical protein
MKMDEEGGMTWDKIVTMIFVVVSILVLILLVFFMFVMPLLKD